MKDDNMNRFLFSGSLAALLLAATPALAHVELETDKAPADSNFKAVLMVPHGCAGSATIGLRVQIPEGVIQAKPMPKPGWKLLIVEAKLRQPVDYEGTKLTEDVREIDWTGGNLPNAYYDEFTFVAKLPDKPGAVIYFPVVQQCAKGESRWIEIPAQGQSGEDLKLPAPSLTLGPKQAGGDD
jgi:periplasmic copper chaperone A